MNLREFLVLLSTSVVWGFHIVVIKIGVAAAPPMFYAAMRMSLVAILLAPFLRWRPGKMGRVFAAGACLGAFNYALMFTGIRLAPASASAIAIELYVPFATILSIVFLGETVGWRRTLGIALAFVGVAVVALGRAGAGAGGELAILGVGLVAAAALTEAMGAIFVKQSAGFRPHELLAWFALLGTLVLWSLTLLFEHGQSQSLLAGDRWLIAGAVAFSAIGASIYAHTAYYWLLQRLPVSQVAPSGLLTTIFAVGASVVFLGEPLTPLFLVGGLMALTGVAIILIRSTKSPIVEPGAPEPVVLPPIAIAPAPRAAGGAESVFEKQA